MAEGALGNIGNTAASTIGSIASDPIGTLGSFVSDPTQEIDLGLGIANPSPAGIVSSLAGKALSIPALGFVGPAIGLASIVGDAFGPSTGKGFSVGQQTAPKPQNPAAKTNEMSEDLKQFCLLPM